ncbi:MAG: phosphate signaling complex protein PhoU [Candidatus Hydrogenedentes bacterium]|nr:phosphate signaling complex protein PhoU [Candidatus Hydrogenedentota bacterium]
MSGHIFRELEKLKKKVLILGTRVEETLHDAVRSLENRDLELAQRVIDLDIEIDFMEVDIEEECLKVLALYQPVAADLRLIVAVLKINNDLERVGDIAVNIAERATFLGSRSPVTVEFDFRRMSEETENMLKLSLDALVNADVSMARQVCIADDIVDNINRKMYIQVQDAIRKHPEDLDAFIHILSISRHLERIADLATNIAEDVIYMAHGEIVRHRVEDYVHGAHPRQDKPA